MEKSFKQLCTEIEALKKQAEAVRKKELAKVVAEVRRLVKEYGLSAADCGFSVEKAQSRAPKRKKTAVVKSTVKAKGSSILRKPVPVKYRHPDNAALTWTGRGKVPKWLVEEEGKGKQRQAFLV